MGEMIKRVEDAISLAVHMAISEGVVIEFESAARAAIEAMREPTRPMIEAVNSYSDEVGFETEWNAAIEAALK